MSTTNTDGAKTFFRPLSLAPVLRALKRAGEEFFWRTRYKDVVVTFAAAVPPGPSSMNTSASRSLLNATLVHDSDCLA